MNLSSKMGIGSGRMPDLSAMREKMFAKADANGDQAISFEEFEKAGKKLPGGIAGSAGNAREGSSKDVFGKIDTDGNGSLSKDEMKSFGDRMSSQMQGMMISLQAMMGGKKPDFEAMFGKIDGDGNGSVSRTEFDKAAKDNPLAQLLGTSKIDTDGDGSLSKGEMKSFAEALRERLGAGGQSPNGQGAGQQRADYLQAMNAYTGGGGKDGLTATLLKMTEAGRNQTNGNQAAGNQMTGVKASSLGVKA
jgi:Ca2+-binding EF-hand superfamily protein